MPFINPNLQRIAILVVIAIFVKCSLDFYSEIIAKWWEEITLFIIGYLIFYVLMCNNYSIKSRIVIVISILLWIKYVLFEYGTNYRDMLFFGLAGCVLLRGFDWPNCKGPGPGRAGWRPRGHAEHRLTYYNQGDYNLRL